jgi:hypothetical protein
MNLNVGKTPVTVDHLFAYDLKYITVLKMFGEPGTSVSIVSGYGLDDRAIEVRFPAEAKGFFLSHLCPDRLWGPPGLLYDGYRGSFPQG